MTLNEQMNKWFKDLLGILPTAKQRSDYNTWQNPVLPIQDIAYKLRDTLNLERQKQKPSREEVEQEFAKQKLSFKDDKESQIGYYTSRPRIYLYNDTRGLNITLPDYHETRGDE